MAPDTAEPALMPTLEEGWVTLLDGLQIHRYHLQVRPAADRQLEELHARHGNSRVPLPDLVRRYGAAVLEHLLHPAQPEPWTDTAGALPHGPLAVVLDAPGPVLSSSALTDRAPALPPQTLQRVRASADTAGLGYLIELVAGVIVLTDEPGDAAPLEPVPFSTVRVRREPSVLGQANEVLGAAGRQLFACFARAGGVKAADTATLRSPITGAYGDAATVGGDLVEAAVRLRHLVAVGNDRRLEPSAADRAWLARRSAALGARLAHCDDVLDALQDAIGEPNTYDLVCSFVPSERRFIRYREGGGLGQH